MNYWHGYKIYLRAMEDNRVGVFTSGIFIKPEFQRKGYAKEALF